MTAPPPPGQTRLPSLEARVLRQGGDRVVLARRASVPLVQVRALLPGAGGRAAAIAAGCLLRRPAARTRLDEAGATAEVVARPDGLVVSAAVAPDGARQLVRLLRELLRPEGPPAADVVASETARLMGVDAVARRDAGERVRRAALARVYGAESPLAEPEPAASPMDPDDVQAWHAGTGSALVVVCGEVDPAAWSEPEAPLAEAGAAAPVAAEGPVPRWAVRDRPGAEQTTLRAAAPVPPAGGPDRAAFEVVQRLLGGGKGSRLVHELRERRGYGYHPGSHVVDLSTGSYLLLEADVATGVTADAVRVVDDVLTSLTDDPPTGEALELAQRGVVADLARALDGQGTLADLLLSRAAAGAAPSSLPEVAAAVVATTSEQVSACARQLLDGLRGAAAANTAALQGHDLPATWAAPG